MFKQTIESICRSRDIPNIAVTSIHQTVGPCFLLGHKVHVRDREPFPLSSHAVHWTAVSLVEGYVMVCVQSMGSIDIVMYDARVPPITLVGFCFTGGDHAWGHFRCKYIVANQWLYLTRHGTIRCCEGLLQWEGYPAAARHVTQQQCWIPPSWDIWMGPTCYKFKLRWVLLFQNERKYCSIQIHVRGGWIQSCRGKFVANGFIDRMRSPYKDHTIIAEENRRDTVCSVS